jgi:hypothetical protein
VLRQLSSSSYALALVLWALRVWVLVPAALLSSSAMFGAQIEIPRHFHHMLPPY